MNIIIRWRPKSAGQSHEAKGSKYAHIQGKLSAASLKLSEMVEILDDEAIQVLVTLQPERDLLRELMVSPTIQPSAHEEINF